MRRRALLLTLVLSASAAGTRAQAPPAAPQAAPKTGAQAAPEAAAQAAPKTAAQAAPKTAAQAAPKTAAQAAPKTAAQAASKTAAQAAPKAAAQAAPKTAPGKAAASKAPAGVKPGPRTEPATEHLLAGRHDAAREAFAERLARDPGDLPAAIGAAALFEQRNDAGSAVGVLAKALARRGVTDAESAGALAGIVLMLPRTPDGGAAALPLLRDLLDGKPAALLPEARGLVVQTLAATLARTGDPAAGARLARDEGRLASAWTLLGPYGRLERLELDVPFPPEQGDTTPQDDPPAADGLPPSRVDTHFADGRVVVPVQFRSFGFLYAAADLVAPRPATVRLVAGSPASFRLFVDGMLALEADRTRERPPETLAARVRLSAGRHRVLVKLANGGRFTPLIVALEPATPGDTAWRALAWAPLEEGMGAQGTAAVEPWPSPLDTPPPPAAARPSASLAATWWLKVRGLDEAVGSALRAAREAWPKAPLVAARLGEWWLNARTGRSVDEDLRVARTLLGEAIGADPNLVRPRLLLARMDETAGQLTDAWQGTGAALAAAPEDPDALLLRHRIAARRGWTPEADAAIERARAAAPGRTDVLDTAIEHYRQIGASSRLEDALAEKARRNPVDESRADALTNAGRADEARTAWEQIIALRPTYMYPYLGLARLHADAGQIDRALEALDRARALYPYEPYLAQRRAGLLALAGRDEEATAELANALEFDPSRIEIAESLQRRGSPDPLARWLGDAREILSAAPKPAPGTDSALLADIASVLIDRQGGQTELYQGIHAVYTRAGVEREGELDVLPGARVQGIRIHKQDGRYADVQPGEKRPVSLPGLEPGDAIEYVWRRYIPPYQALPGALDSRTLFMFQAEDREFVLSRYVVIHPKDMPLEVCGNTRGLTATDEENGPWRVRSWTARAMPRVAVEPHTADPLEVIPNVRLGLSLTWADIARLAADALAPLLQPDEPLPAIASEIRKRAGSDDPERLARTLHAVLLERVRPGGSALTLGVPASVAASAGEGNRAAVALALARMLKLPARLLLARPIEQRGRQLDCPSTGAFGYPLVAVTVGGRDVLLDYTDADHPFDTIPPRISGSDALEVPLDAPRAADGASAPRGGIVALPVRDPGVLQESEADLTLGSDGRVEGTYTLRARGPVGAAMRRVLRELPREQRPIVFRQIAADTFGGASVADASVAGENDPEADLTVMLRISGGVFGRRTPTGFGLPVVANPLALLNEYAALPKRTHALLLDTQEFRKDTLTLRLPDGLAPVTVPSPVTQAADTGGYGLLVKTEPGRITSVRTVRIPPARIEPEDYDDFRRLARAIDDAESREILVGISSPSLAR